MVEIKDSNIENLVCNESGLEEFKKDYIIFKDKYNLPEFSRLNELFEIEDLEGCETEFLLKKIRKIIADKLSSYVRVIEIILNPSNAPMFFFKLIKKLDENDKAKLNYIYDEFSRLDLSIIGLDLDYNEEKEADFIKNVFNKFDSIRKDFLKIIEKMENSKDKLFENNNRSYFG